VKSELVNAQIRAAIHTGDVSPFDAAALFERAGVAHEHVNTLRTSDLDLVDQVLAEEIEEDRLISWGSYFLVLHFF
jgi:hypothetical protein